MAPLIGALVMLKGGEPMLLQAMVLEGDVREQVFYDQVTGAPVPGYAVNMTVLDIQTHEKYQCQITEGFAGLEHLKELRRQKQPVELLREAAEQLRAQLPPIMTHLTLEVLRIKGKSAAYLTLICRLAEVAEMAAA
jgi:hypothetical protein